MASEQTQQAGWLERQKSHIHPVVFPVSAILIIAFLIFGAVFTGTAETVLEDTRFWITDNLGWFFIVAVAVFLLFCLYLAIGPYGKVRLGPDDSRPDYSNLTWFAMLFSAGMGIGLVFWGVAEPLWHFADAPRVADATQEAARDSMALTYHHWGLGPWAVYAVLGLSLAYFGFRHNLPLTVRSALYPLIGDRMNGWMGNVVDILAILGTMFGIATSLGLGVLQINAGLGDVYGAPVNDTMAVLLIAVITLVATVSVFTGLDRGIRRLSQVNINLAGLLLLFVAIAGPTVLLLRAYVENLGGYIYNFVDMMFWAGTYGGEEWLPWWTVFYWAWWVSWAPFVGMFIARISRGRTIREFVLGVLFVPALVSFAWFTVFGNSAITMELEGTLDVAAAMIADNTPEIALFGLLQQFPLYGLTGTLAVLVIAIFFVTSSDSGSYVIDMIASGGDPNPPRSHRVMWALAEGFVAAVLLLAGGLAALQAGAISTGLPFTVVLVIVMIGLWKGLRTERAGIRLADMPDQPLTGNGEADGDQSGAMAGTKRDDA